MRETQELGVCIGLRIKPAFKKEKRISSKKCSCNSFKKSYTVLSKDAIACPYCGEKDLICVLDTVHDYVLLNELILKGNPKTTLKIEHNPYDDGMFITSWYSGIKNVCDDEVRIDLNEIKKFAESQQNQFKTKHSSELEYLQSVLESVEVVSIVKCEHDEEYD